jgi:hypothetical protein
VYFAKPNKTMFENTIVVKRRKKRALWISKGDIDSILKG